MIDRSETDGSYSAAVGVAQGIVDDPDKTLSARIVSELEQSGSSFFEFALGMANCHHEYFASIAPLRAVNEKNLADEVAASVARQADIEAADDISLDDYLQRYFTAC
jgi:glutamate--cysteine ligase